MRRNNYFGGFMFLLGLVIGSVIMYLLSVKTVPASNKVEITIHSKDSLQVDSGTYIRPQTSFNRTQVPIQKKKVNQLKNEPLNEKTLLKELKRNNIHHPRIVVAQAKLESNLGKSDVYKRTNNLFGLRKGNRYRRFSSWQESVVAYKNLIQSQYNGGNYYEFLRDMNYAEDVNYINKLKDMV